MSDIWRLRLKISLSRLHYPINHPSLKTDNFSIMTNRENLYFHIQHL